MITPINVLPDEIFDDASPLEDLPIDLPTEKFSDVFIDGNNVYVTTVTGNFYVGGFYWVNDHKFTVGQSDPIDVTIVETARNT